MNSFEFDNSKSPATIEEGNSVLSSLFCFSSGSYPSADGRPFWSGQVTTEKRICIL